MKYLKKYSLFLEEVEPDEKPEGTDDIQESPVTPETNSKAKQTALNMVKKKSDELNVFKQKRTTMENIFKNPKIQTDAELSQELLSKVYNNKKLASEQEDKFKSLRRYEDVLRAERRKNKLKQTIDNDKAKLKKIKSDAEYDRNLLNAQKQGSDKEEMVKINAEIAELDSKVQKDSQQVQTNISKNQEILNRDIINWKKKMDDYKKDVKAEEEKLKSQLSNLQK